MKRIGLFMIAALAVCCQPIPSNTTLIRGVIEEGAATEASINVLDYDINETFEIKNNAFSIELLTNKAIVATVSCTVDGKSLSVPVILDGVRTTVRFWPDSTYVSSANPISLNYRLSEEEAIYKDYNALTSRLLSLRRSGASRDDIAALQAEIDSLWEEMVDNAWSDIDFCKDNYLSVKGLATVQPLLSDEQIDSVINTLDPTVLRTARIRMIQKAIEENIDTENID